MTASPLFFNPNPAWLCKYWQYKSDDFVEFLRPEKTDYQIQKEKAILMKVAQYVSYSFLPFDSFLKKKCKDEVDIIQDMSVYLDGELVSEHCEYVQSPKFKLGHKTAISEGYWLCMKELPEGNHTIQSFASCRSGKVQIPQEYHIEIK